MWWHDKCTDRSAFSARGSAGHGGVAPAPAALAHGRMIRAAAALAIAALAGGCFQPLYGEQSPTGGPVLRDQLSAVEVLQIPAPKGTDESRIAVEIRNALIDRKSTRLNSSHLGISYAVFCLKKKNNEKCTFFTNQLALTSFTPVF